jgi:hypothetical protein
MMNSNILETIYYDEKHPDSYSTAKKLYKAAKLVNPSITLPYVQNWLSGELTYTLHKPIRRHFKRNPIVVETVDEQWEADLVDMQAFSRQNSGYKYIVTVIDTLSKYAWARPLKSKTSKSVIDAFKIIFEDERVPAYIRTDQGREFNNAVFKRFLDSRDIKYFTSKNKDIKCAIVERFNRTLKARMFKYFTAKGTRRYIDVLQDLVSAYNSSYHSTIKTAPVNAVNSEQLFKTVYKVNSPRDLLMNNKQEKLKENDLVRKAYEKTLFDKSYYPNWTDQTFRIKSITKGVNKPYYVINDKRYYPEQIQKIKDNQVYRVEKIIKRKFDVNGRLMYFVKWLNYPTSFNSWIYAVDVIRI